jgi:hypothetical protein
MDPPPPPPPQVGSGTFDFTATVGFNGCNLATAFDTTYTIEIDSTSFTMGEWTGTWNPTTRKAYCESPHHQTTTRGCTITTWTAVNITFTNANSFYGSVTYRKRVSGTCSCCTACQSSWNIRGTRVTP